MLRAERESKAARPHKHGQEANLNNSAGCVLGVNSLQAQLIPAKHYKRAIVKLPVARSAVFDEGLSIKLIHGQYAGQTVEPVLRAATAIDQAMSLLFRE